MIFMRNEGMSKLPDNSLMTHVERVKKCASREMNEYAEKDSLEITKILISWWKNMFYGDASAMCKLEDMLKPYGMKVPTALWCVSFFDDNLRSI